MSEQQGAPHRMQDWCPRLILQHNFYIFDFIMVVQFLFSCNRDYSWSNRLLLPFQLLFLITLSSSILSNGYISGTSGSVLRQSIFIDGKNRRDRRAVVYHRSSRNTNLASKTNNEDIHYSKKHHELLNEKSNISRRLLLLQGATIITTTPSVVSGLAPPSDVTNGLLQRRLQENVITSPYYGMQNTDIFYPSYFTGVWEVTSTCTDIQKPVPSMSQPQEQTQKKVDDELGKPYQYKVRFIPYNEERCIADREYNVKEILAAYGTASLLDISLATPNQFTCTLSLPTKDNISNVTNKEEQQQQQKQLVTVDILTLARKQEEDEEEVQESTSRKLFACSEVVRQIVAPLGSSNGTPLGSRSRTSTTTTATTQSPFYNVKEVETISLYSYTDNNNQATPTVPSIQCQQRTATYLVPSTTDPVAFRMWQATQGKPIDVRFYNVLYTKVK